MTILILVLSILETLLGFGIAAHLVWHVVNLGRNIRAWLDAKRTRNVGLLSFFWSEATPPLMGLIGLVLYAAACACILWTCIRA